VVVAAAPLAIRGLIEARGVGILKAEALAATRIGLVVDLDTVESERLPPLRTSRILGVDLPLLHKVEGPHFPAAILQYVKAGRNA
jgi:HPr kinase/phosphorylase